ncbi:MAG: ASPIC/UnbV domain-containing protein [Singulisphaera sp.]
MISLMDGRPAILMNESERHPWIRLELLCGRSPRPAIGAAVEVHAGGRVIHRQLKGGSSYHSANDPRLLVGLGSADRVDKVDVRWPDGTRSTLTEPAINRTHRVVEPGAGSPARLPAETRADDRSSSARGRDRGGGRLRGAGLGRLGRRASRADARRGRRAGRGGPVRRGPGPRGRARPAGPGRQ